ncbi:MAG: hypothetical protein HS126_00090 [Anaerolineales bacterium]|nr:hypothetical protein [Anaerolineales bacterium]
MSLIELWKELHRLGVIIKANGDKVVVDAPAGVLTDNLRSALSQHKSALLVLLQEPDQETVPPGWPKTVLWPADSKAATIGTQWERLEDGTIKATYNTPYEMWLCLQFVLWGLE